MHLEDNFTPGGPATQVPASWFNRVAKFLNNLIPGEGVSFDKHDDGSPTVITTELFDESITADAFPYNGNGHPSTDGDGKSAQNDNSDLTTDYHALDASTWVRGTTRDASGNLCGVKLRVITRQFRYTDEDVFFFRVLEFDSTGRLRSISAETDSFREKNKSFY